MDAAAHVVEMVPIEFASVVSMSEQKAVIAGHRIFSKQSPAKLIGEVLNLHRNLHQHLSKGRGRPKSVGFGIAG